MQRISSTNLCKRLFVIVRRRERTPTDLIFGGLDHVISMLIATSSSELKRTEGGQKLHTCHIRAMLRGALSCLEGRFFFFFFLLYHKERMLVKQKEFTLYLLNLAPLTWCVQQCVGLNQSQHLGRSQLLPLDSQGQYFSQLLTTGSHEKLIFSFISLVLKSNLSFGSNRNQSKVKTL